MSSNVTLDWLTRSIRRIRKIRNKAAAAARKAQTINTLNKSEWLFRRCNERLDELETAKRKLVRLEAKTCPNCGHQIQPATKSTKNTATTNTATQRSNAPTAVTG